MERIGEVVALKLGGCVNGKERSCLSSSQDWRSTPAELRFFCYGLYIWFRPGVTFFFFFF